MKKMMIVAAMMLSSVVTFAQNAVGQLTVQPKVGLNIATLTKADGSDPRYGLAAGAEFEYGVTDMVGISAGAIYSMQGCKSDDTTLKLDYINIPILANVYVAKGLAVKLGVQPAFNVNSSFKIKSGSSSAETDVDAKSFDFSIPVGLSYQIDNFVIDGRYNWGLTKVADNSDCKNSVFQITLGYKFAL
jgi:hypothetical protein